MEKAPLVTTEWLSSHLDDPGVAVVDCRWYLAPFDMRDGRAEYAAGHIPGAVHVDWFTDIADPDDPISGQIAGPDRYRAAMEARGIGDDTFVVSYDDHHVPVASRLWWTLQVYGHHRAAVLDGGITRWTAEARPLSTAEPTPAAATFTPRYDRSKYATKDDVVAALADDRVVLVDARMQPAYEADGGHIPGMVRLPGIEFLADGESWMSPAQCRERIEEAGLADSERTIIYCGGGVAATGAAVAYELAGLSNVSVYDGSWTEWRTDDGVPKVWHGSRDATS